MYSSWDCKGLKNAEKADEQVEALAVDYCRAAEIRQYVPKDGQSESHES